ncbi:putative adhesion G protein-coupled receptor E4P [Littorina saxatilis]|uniref:putative adhesion G protein-coupled receptor E4P n=1 Tax=Littorina saxatilis TaxID=31220 RepID=UPI0038B613D1
MEHTLQISKAHFWETDDVVYVCVGYAHILRHRPALISKWQEVEQTLTDVGLILSVVCLSLTLLLYSVFRPLRNQHGQKVMCMAGTLLLAKASFWLSNVHDDVMCQVVAILLHFLWLSAFSWMSTVSLDLAQTFMNNVPSKGPTDCCSRGLPRQALRSFFPPTVLVTTFVILHVQPDIKGYVRYGRSRDGCRLTTQVGLLAGVIVPVGLSLVFNLVCFVVALISIERKRMSKKMGRYSGEKRLQGGCCRVLLYLKLSLVMGGPWLLSYFAESLATPWLLVISVALSSLQGVLVFCVYTCNRNVYGMFRRAVLGCKKRKAKKDCLEMREKKSGNSVCWQLRSHQHKVQ